MATIRHLYHGVGRHGSDQVRERGESLDERVGVGEVRGGNTEE